MSPSTPTSGSLARRSVASSVPGVLVGTVLAALGAACGDGPTVVEDVAVVSRSVRIGTVDRTFRLYTPPTVEAGTPSPLILVYHGAGQSAAAAEQMTWFYPSARDARVRVAFMASLGDYWSTPASPPGAWAVDDMGFTRGVIDTLVAEGAVDPERVYATGYSNGAVFVQRLACYLPGRIAAVSMVAATVSRELTAACSFPRGMPSMFFLGDADNQFYWDEGVAANFFQYGGPGSAGYWAGANGCPASPDTVTVPDRADDGTTAELWHYTGCRDGAELRFYRIVRGGHTWPGSPLAAGALGAQSQDVDASRWMTEFFLRWRHPDPAS